MSHVRKQVRDRVVTVLTGLKTTGTNIFNSRFHPFLQDGAELPGLCVYVTSEEIVNDEDGIVSHVQERLLDLVIEGYAAESADIEDTLDMIADEVETAIFADQFLNSTAQGTDLVATEIGIADDAEVLVGVVEMHFRVHYLTTEGAPGTAL